MSTEFYLLAVLVALLLGLVVGKAWERYKLRDGRWIDRRRLRETPHYMLGLNFLVENQVDQAIDELTQAASTDSDALEIQMILGNLYRQKGQVSRAINVHQALLRNEIGAAHADAVDLAQAARTFEAAIDVDARTPPAYLNLGDVYERQGSLAAAVEAWEQLVRLSPDRAYLAFDRLERAYRALGSPRRFADMCRRLIDRNPQDWRARLALSRHPSP